MSKKWIISSNQFKLLVILCYLGTAILITPRGLAFEAKQDAWIAVLFGIIFSLFLVWLYNSLGSLFPNMTIVQYSQKLLGKWLGKLLSFFFIIFAFLNAAMLLWFVGDFIATQILIETPIEAINTLFMIIIIMAARLGLETFSRAAEVMFPFVIIFFILLILLIIKDIEVLNMLPILENGIKPIIRGALLFTSYSSVTLIILLMIFPSNIDKQIYAKKAFLKGNLIAGLIIFIITDLCILVLGYDLTARNTFSVYILAKKINVSDFLERVEVVIAVSWIITIFYKILFYFYGSVLGLAQILNLKDYSPLTLPLGMILIVLSLVVYPNSTYAQTWNRTIWIPFSFTFGLFFPLILFLIGKFTKGFNEKKQ